MRTTTSLLDEILYTGADLDDDLLRLDKGPTALHRAKQRYLLHCATPPPEHLTCRLDTVHTLHLCDNIVTDSDFLRLPKNIKIVHFGRNNLSTLSSFEWPESVELLNLAKNKIHTLDGAKWPARCVNLNLRSNRLQRLKDVEWQHLSQLRRLDLSAQLDGIKTVDTKFPVNLEELILTGNRLKSSSLSRI